MPARQVMTGLVLSAVLAAMLTGCSGLGVTMEDFGKVENGMTLAQVEGILGKGKLQTGGAVAFGNFGTSAMVYTWESDQLSMSVVFVNDKVAAKEAVVREAPARERNASLTGVARSPDVG